MTRALPTGVRRKVHVLEDRRRRVLARIERNADGPDHVLDWWKAEAAALDFAIDVIRSDFGGACKVLSRRREEAGTL